MTAPTKPVPYEPPGDWRAEAACRGVDPEMFYAERGGRSHRAAAAAKAVCNTCPSVQPCLIAALSLNEEFGVWGGLTSTQRRSAARVFGRMKVCSTCGQPFHVRASQGVDIYCGAECRAEARRRVQLASRKRREEA